MIIRRGILATTHLDLHGERMAISALHQLAECINSGYLPFGVQHDPRIAPVGRVVSAVVKQLADGEYGVEGLMEIFEPGDEIRLESDSREIPILGVEGESLVIEYDRNFADPEDQALIKRIAGLFGTRPQQQVKKALEPISILIIVGSFALASIASGFLNKLGADGFDALKSALKDLFRRDRVSKRENLLMLKAIVSGEDHEIEVDVVLTNPTGAQIDTFFKTGLAELDRVLPRYWDMRSGVKRIVYKYQEESLSFSFGVRKDGVPLGAMHGAQESYSRSQTPLETSPHVATRSFASESTVADSSKPEPLQHHGQRMGPMLRKDDSPETVAQIDQLERRADQCESGLALYAYPMHVATWAVLTQNILSIEDAIQKSGFGSPRHRETMINLSKAGATFLPWVRKHCAASDTQIPPWDEEIASAALQLQNVAHNYSLFLSNFPMWRKDRVAAELISANCVRFTTLVEDNQRRIRAFQQGVRVGNWPATIDEPRGKDFIKDPDVMASMQSLAGACQPVGFRGFTYPEPRDLQSRLSAIYRRRLESASRWAPSLRLGGYTMGEFRSFYAALLAVSSIHEHLCFRWSQMSGQYPVDSALLAKHRTDWIGDLAWISGLAPTLVDQILSDLTFGRTRPLEIYIHPFIPATPNDSLIFLIPSLPLNSRADENILRVFSYTHRNEYQQFSKGKEEEMRNDLVASNPHNFYISGPISLPGNRPDIDLLLEDLNSSTLLICEMKWTRKTLLPREHVDRDEELLYGAGVQLRRIQEFVATNPEHLKSIGACALSLNAYAAVRFLLVARDHLVWIPVQQDRYVVAYDAFNKMLAEHHDLGEGVADLLRYEWLPLEGREFRVEFQRATVNGVTVEAEIYHRILS